MGSRSARAANGALEQIHLPQSQRPGADREWPPLNLFAQPQLAPPFGPIAARHRPDGRAGKIGPPPTQTARQSRFTVRWLAIKKAAWQPNWRFLNPVLRKLLRCQFPGPGIMPRMAHCARTGFAQGRPSYLHSNEPAYPHSSNPAYLHSSFQPETPFFVVVARPASPAYLHSRIDR